MTEQRTVTIHMDVVEQQNMAQVTNYTEWYRAIGRLATWHRAFPCCNIYREGSTDLVAIYLNEQGERGHVIKAVWHDDHYGFHS